MRTAPILLLLAALPAAAAPAAAAPQGEPAWGFSFEPPPGFEVVEKDAAGALLAAADGLSHLMVEPHGLETLAELRAATGEGYRDDAVHLEPAGPIRAFGRDATAVAAELEGFVDGQAARAYGLAALSPFGGGALVLGAAAARHWHPGIRRAVEAVARSLVFVEPTAPAGAAAHAPDWRRTLAGRCLVGGAGDGPGGPPAGATPGARREPLFLFTDGTFQRGARFAPGAGLPEVGSWRIGGSQDRATLELTYPEGSAEIYALGIDADGDALLDGERYRLVGYEECADL